MSATIPSHMMMSDLLKATGYDCPDNLKNKTFKNATLGPDVDIESGREMAYTANGEYTIEPSEGFGAMDSVDVVVNVPSSAKPEQAKSVSITQAEPMVIEPDEGKALSSVTVTPVLQSKSVTRNGVVAADTGYAGLSQVTVNVSGGGGDVSLETNKAVSITENGTTEITPTTTNASVFTDGTNVYNADADITGDPLPAGTLVNSQQIGQMVSLNTVRYSITGQAYVDAYMACVVDNNGDRLWFMLSRGNTRNLIPNAKIPLDDTKPYYYSNYGTISSPEAGVAGYNGVIYFKIGSDYYKDVNYIYQNYELNLSPGGTKIEAEALIQALDALTFNDYVDYYGRSSDMAPLVVTGLTESNITVDSSFESADSIVVYDETLYRNIIKPDRIDDFFDVLALYNDGLERTISYATYEGIKLYDGMEKVTVTTAIPLEANKAQTITENGTVEIEPSSGNMAMEKVTVTVNVPTKLYGYAWNEETLYAGKKLTSESSAKLLSVQKNSLDTYALTATREFDPESSEFQSGYTDSDKYVRAKLGDVYIATTNLTELAKVYTSRDLVTWTPLTVDGLTFNGSSFGDYRAGRITVIGSSKVVLYCYYYDRTAKTYTFSAWLTTDAVHFTKILEEEVEKSDSTLSVWYAEKDANNAMIVALLVKTSPAVCWVTTDGWSTHSAGVTPSVNPTTNDTSQSDSGLFYITGTDKYLLYLNKVAYTTDGTSPGSWNELATALFSAAYKIFQPVAGGEVYIGSMAPNSAARLKYTDGTSISEIAEETLWVCAVAWVGTGFYIFSTYRIYRLDVTTHFITELGIFPSPYPTTLTDRCALQLDENSVLYDRNLLIEKGYILSATLGADTYPLERDRTKDMEF